VAVGFRSADAPLHRCAKAPLGAKRETMKLIMAVALFLAITVCASANDSAVETAAGGLKLHKEQSVLMKKERLYISKKIVRVEYEFLNTSKKTVVSEVAFPIPPVEFAFEDPGGSRDFPDFKAWINDVPKQVEKEVRAFVKTHEVTEALRKARLPIETFGDFDPSEQQNPIATLKPEVRKALVKAGALRSDGNEYWPEWEVHIKYHWRQEFPPGTIVRIKHEYAPVAGFGGAVVKDFKENYKESCIDPTTYSELKRQVADDYFNSAWVNYILTTANTWQTPIEDFELVVEGKQGDLLSFCWDGPVEKIGPAKIRAKLQNFIPKDELKVYFLSPQPKVVTGSAKKTSHSHVKEIVFLYIFILLGFLFKTAVTLLLLRSYRLRTRRLSCAYLAVTIILSTMLFSLILPAVAGNMVLAILLVIILETATLFMLTNLAWFRTDKTTDPLLRTLVMAVVCGNVAFLVVCSYILLPFEMGLLKLLFNRH
jgi:hypothetical protein